jgi:hypothetical protein
VCVLCVCHVVLLRNEKKCRQTMSPPGKRFVATSNFSKWKRYLRAPFTGCGEKGDVRQVGLATLAPPGLLISSTNDARTAFCRSSRRPFVLCGCSRLVHLWNQSSSCHLARRSAPNAWFSSSRVSSFLSVYNHQRLPLSISATYSRQAPYFKLKHGSRVPVPRRATLVFRSGIGRLP